MFLTTTLGRVPKVEESEKDRGSAATYLKTPNQGGVGHSRAMNNKVSVAGVWLTETGKVSVEGVWMAETGKGRGGREPGPKARSRDWN